MSGARRILPVLLIGDAVSFLLFAALGRAEHATGLSIAGVVSTAAPFLAAWAGVALWLRAFEASAVASPAAAARRAALAWLLAWPIGLQLRALLLDRAIPFSFAAVVFATNALLLVGWRVAYSHLRSRREQR